MTGFVDFNFKIWDVKIGEEKFKLIGYMVFIIFVGYSVSMGVLNLKYMFYKIIDFRRDY